MTPAAVLAASFTIAFEGLMMFQGESNGYKHLAIVYEPAHHVTPHIEIWHLNQQGTYDHQQDIILKLDDRVTFYDAPSGKIVDDKFYRKHVPPLKDYIVKGHVHDDVVDKTSNPDVLAFVDLPGGVTTTFRTFKERVRLTRKSGFPKKWCFARFAVLSVSDSANPQKITIVGPQSGSNDYPISRDDLIIISNVSSHQDELHFPNYAKLLNKNGEVSLSEILEDDACDTFDGSTQLPKGIQDVLNNLYQRAPNGDCGAVGNP